MQRGGYNLLCLIKRVLLVNFCRVFSTEKENSEREIKVRMCLPSPAPLPASASCVPPAPASPVAASPEQKIKGTAVPSLPGWTQSQRKRDNVTCFNSTDIFFPHLVLPNRKKETANNNFK